MEQPSANVAAYLLGFAGTALTPTYDPESISSRRLCVKKKYKALATAMEGGNADGVCNSHLPTLRAYLLGFAALIPTYDPTIRG